MKIAIVGTGGVGGYFGSRLAVAGHDVHFIARGSHLAAMRKDGLRVNSPLGDMLVNPVQATDDPETVGPCDVVLVAVKLWDTESAVTALQPLVGQSTAVISLQNGVEKDEILSRHIDRRNHLGGVCYIAAAIGAPGVIDHSGKMARITFGELDGSKSDRAVAFHKALTDASVSAELSTDITREIWEKFVFLVGLSSTTALIRQPIGPIRSDATTRSLLLDTMQETVNVGIAKGVRLARNFAEDRLAFCDSIPATMMSSMQVDLSRGNRLELDWLCGAVTRFGQECQVDTPANRLTYAALKLYAAGAPEASSASYAALKRHVSTQEAGR